MVVRWNKYHAVWRGSPDRPSVDLPPYYKDEASERCKPVPGSHGALPGDLGGGVGSLWTGPSSDGQGGRHMESPVG